MAQLNASSVLIYITCCLVTIVYSKLDVKQFSFSPDSPPLHSVTYNNLTGTIYVGGRNVLLQLDSNLTLVQELKKGPIRDSSTCDPDGECPDGNLEPNDYKIVEISWRKNFLLACGTSKQGMCSFHSLANISNSRPIKGPIPDKLMGSHKSCLVYLSPDSKSADEVLYVFQEYDGRLEKYSPHVMSMRKLVLNKQDHELQYFLDDKNMFQISGLNIHPELRANYYMSFVSTFKWQNFLYFVMNTQKDVKRSNDVRINIARLCYGTDIVFRSYIQMELQCSLPDDESIVYNKATAAIVVKDKLFVTAVRLRSGTRQDIDQTQGTVLCQFDMGNINAVYADGYYDCHRGNAYRLDWNRGKELKCSIDDLDDSIYGKMLANEYCGEYEQKPGVRSVRNVKMESLLKMETIVKALKPVMETDTFAVLGMGDMDGNFHKVVVKDPKHFEVGENKRARLFLSYKLSHKPISADMEITKEGDAIVLAGDKVYKFPASSCGLHEDCDTCLRSNDPIGCGWCGTECTTKEHCNGTEPEWMSMSNLKTPSCPPSLYSIYPLAGPTSGGTLVTLKGKNFGFQNDSHIIKIGDVNCDKKKVIDTELVCSTRVSNKEMSSQVSLRVTSHDRLSRRYQIYGQVHSTQIYHFKVPSMSSFTPSRGPRSGGTILTIHGDNLDIGSSIQVLVDGKYLCSILVNSSTELKCVTQKWSALVARRRRFTDRAQASGPLQVKIDSATVMAEKNGEPVKFYYLPDPVIGKVSPARSFVSGGISITVTGTNLDASVSPLMRGMHGNDLGVSVNCKSEPDGTKMVCPSLNVKRQLGEIKRPPQVVHIYFDFDGNNIPSNPLRADISSFQYYPDPTFRPFIKTVQQFEDKEELVFPGRNLHLGFSKNDIKVLVGNKPCNVTNINDIQLTCKPSPDTIDAERGTKHSVKITVGSLVFRDTDIGFVEFVRGEEPASAMNFGLVALIVICTLVVLAVLVLCLVMRRKRCGFFKPKYEHEGSIQYTANRDAHSGLIGPSSPRSPNLDNDYTDGGIYPYGAGAMASPKAQIDEETLHLIESENLLVDRECLTLANEIGKGNFGCVRRGFLTLPDQKGDILVAVKTLHDNNPRDIQLQSFLQEALRMKEFHHRNVLTLIGVCLELDSMPLVVLPFMKHGDLLTYIKDENNQPTIKDLILYSIDIAKGMEYLSGLKFVHRDLAARNCMLDEELHVRVADFGLARDIYERDYYCSDNKKTKLPVKWMAIESLEKGNYSAKSDVWSFGVVLWELMTRGAMPYPEVDSWDMTRYLKAGRRMPHPQFCPDPLYEVMMQCWQGNPADRPTFGQLAIDIREMVERIMHQTGVANRNIQTTYVNLGECNNYYYQDDMPQDDPQTRGSTRSNKSLATSGQPPIDNRSISSGSRNGATGHAMDGDEEGDEPTESTALRV